MNDDEVHRNALSAGLFVMSALVAFGVFYLVSCAIFNWWNS
jgi:hypothetical protein